MKMKRCLAALAALTMTCTMVPMHTMPETVITAGAQEDGPLTYGHLTYEVQEDGTITITGCAEDAVSVEIPEEIEGKKVTRVGSFTFMDHTSLVSVIIPDSVIEIHTAAFAGCGITNIIIPNPACEIISQWSGVPTIPKDITIHGYSNSGAQEYAEWCGNPFVFLGEAPDDEPLTYGQLTYQVQEDGTIAITGCAEDAVSVEIPEEIEGKKVTSIGRYAFSRRTSLVSVNIPEGVTSIETRAFYSCTSLTSITIPDSVTSIGRFAVSGCDNLRDITILNPDCEIYDEAGTISNGYDYTGTITGYEGSTAQAYAEKYGRTFVSLGEATTPEYKTGDIDGDGELNAVDASLLLAAAALAGQGQPSGLTPEQEKAADVDGKDGFNAVDASYILQYAAYVGNNPGADIDIRDFIAGV